MNKKIASAVLFCAVLASASAQAFSLTDIADISGNKAKLQSCLAEEGQKILADDKIASTRIDALAKNIAAICASKLSIKNVDDSTVAMAKNILNALAK